jgi:hypothetical protein
VRSFDDVYLRVQQAAEDHPRAVLLIATALFMAAAAGLGALRLDMSFRPLFASGEEIAEPTREFEAVFGQASGAWIATVIESDGASTVELLRTCARLSALAAAVPGVSEAHSLTSLAVPLWERGRLTFVSPLPEYLLQPGEEAELEEQYAGLLDRTRFVGWLVSADGTRLLLAARTDLPLRDLAGRRAVVRELEHRLRGATPAGIRLHFTGVSVVELAYESQVLRDQAIATALTATVLCALLLFCFGSARAVFVCLLPVTLAVPATLGVAGWLGQPVTVLNSVIPALVMAIGVADAVHMLTAWLEARAAGAGRREATVSMLRLTGRACFYSTLTTVIGFLSLQSARLDAVASFGLLAALGILIAWIANQFLVPWLLRRIDAGAALPAGVVNRLADRTVLLSLRSAQTRPRTVVAVASLIALGCLLAIPSLEVDQRFNGELPEAHRVTVAQAILERDFAGFLGPEISVRRVDGGNVVDDDSLARLDRVAAGLRALPDTQQVWSVRDLLPRGVSADERSEALRALREHPVTSRVTRELVNEGQDRLAVNVRTGDIGTRRAGEYHEQIERLLAGAWGDRYETEIVGQWWLAQFGMRLLLRDMAASIATAVLLVLPILWLAVRDRRVFVAATIANVLPLLLPLAVMAVTGISLRIGTVVVLAIAFGIVVDNTLHIGSRLSATGTWREDAERLRHAMHGTGRAVLFTSLALIGAFLSMLFNELLAIRDMGVVAAVTFAGAAAADLLLLPAICLLLQANARGGARTRARRLGPGSPANSGGPV